MKLRTLLLVALAMAFWPSCSYVNLEDDFKFDLTYPLLGDWHLISLDYEKNITTTHNDENNTSREVVKATEMDYIMLVDTSHLIAFGDLKVTLRQEMNNNVMVDYAKSFTKLDCNSPFIRLDNSVHLDGTMFDFQFNGFKAQERMGARKYLFEILDNGHLKFTLDEDINEKDATVIINGTENITSIWERN